MQKIILSLAVILSFGAYSWFLRTHTSSATPLPATTSSQNTLSLPSSTDQTSSAPTTTTPPPTSTPSSSSGQYKNGSYVGSVEDAFYGNVQVKAIINGGKITDVQFLSYPNDRSHSVEINSYATPILRSEAIQTQSANVDIVSGATATSQAFQQSLATALRAAS